MHTVFAFPCTGGWTCGLFPVWGYHSSLGNYLREEGIGHMVGVWFNFRKLPEPSPKRSHHVTTCSVWEFSSPATSPVLERVNVAKFKHPNRYTVAAHCGFICISSMSADVESLFSVSICLLYLFFHEISVLLSVPPLGCFLILAFWEFFGWSASLSNIWLANVSQILLSNVFWRAEDFHFDGG